MWLEQGRAGGWGRKKWVFFFIQDLNTQTETKEAVRCHHHPCHSSEAASAPRAGQEQLWTAPRYLQMQNQLKRPMTITQQTSHSLPSKLQPWELRAEHFLASLQDLEGISTWLHDFLIYFFSQVSHLPPTSLHNKSCFPFNLQCHLVALNNENTEKAPTLKTKF